MQHAGTRLPQAVPLTCKASSCSSDGRMCMGGAEDFDAAMLDIAQLMSQPPAKFALACMMMSRILEFWTFWTFC
jgi:hypothetical protein